MSSTLRRAWLISNIVVTVALLPALFPNRDGGAGTAVAAGAGELTVATTPPSTMVVTTTTSTTSTTAPHATLAVQKRVVHRSTTTTVKARPRHRPTTTTTTVVARRTPSATPAPAAHGSEAGKATWYDYEPGICAHKTLPFGTVVTVHAVNGRSVQCTVGDRGPYVDGYVIDLNQREFEQLAPKSSGRIDCTITW